MKSKCKEERSQLRDQLQKNTTQLEDAQSKVNELKNKIVSMEMVMQDAIEKHENIKLVLCKPLLNKFQYILIYRPL